MLERFEDDDDVQNVYHNTWKITEEFNEFEVIKSRNFAAFSLRKYIFYMFQFQHYSERA